jgi:serine/threonine protein kinase
VHTDLQPANILEAEDGTVTVLDYEHAVRLDARGLWSGELNWGVWEFVPPEQHADFTILDASADVYAVAVLLTYLVRGEVPFRFDVMATQASGGWTAVREEFRRLRAMPCLDGLSAGLRAAVEQVLLVPMEARPRAAQFDMILAGVSHA